jgi:three-Cys-motif partner protein
MAPRKTRSGEGKAHRFGGDWTGAKLEVLAKYLSGYTTALKKQPFVKGYIDAFAGTGYRTARKDRADPSSQDLLFPDLAGNEPQTLLDGSARLALKTEPRFDKYVFIERSVERCAALEALKSEFPHLANDITIRQGDANIEIRDLCDKDKNWSLHRAVLFLDPYGMQAAPPRPAARNQRLARRVL